MNYSRDSIICVCTGRSTYIQIEVYNIQIYARGLGLEKHLLVVQVDTGFHVNATHKHDQKTRCPALSCYTHTHTHTLDMQASTMKTNLDFQKLSNYHELLPPLVLSTARNSRKFSPDPKVISYIRAPEFEVTVRKGGSGVYLANGVV